MKTALRLLAPFGWTLAFWIPAAYAAAYLVEGFYQVPIMEESFRFERPWAALLLPAALLVLAARAWLDRSRAPRLLVSRARAISSGGSGWRAWARGSLTGMRVVALTLVVVALMGPQSIHARDRAEVEGIDIVLVLDLSLSMQAADIVPNRFEATKHVVNDFIQRRPNDRIGAVIFGRDAYTLLPLTTDKESLRGMIAELQLGMIEGRGTAIGNGVGVGLNRLRHSNAKSKVIILLTDGDSNAGNVSPDQAASFAKTMGVKIYAILMGRSGDARVQGGTDIFGRPLWDVGEFPVNPDLLRGMAQRTGGEFFLVSDRRALEQSFHTILDRLEKTELEDLGRVYGELFPAFVAPAVVLLVLELLLGALAFRRWP